jgi:hypothetical protein
MSQALQLSQVDNGDFLGWSYTSTDELFEKYFKNYLKTINVQKDIHVSGDFTVGVKVIFQDGTQAVFSNHSNFVNGTAPASSSFRHPVVVFYARPEANKTDINQKGYNYAKEIFYFLINDDGHLEPPDLGLTREQNIAKCKSSASVDCSTVIVKDGWEIKDDYPWF